MKAFKYTIHDEFDKVFDEKGNTFLSIRKLSWGDKTDWKYDIRKWMINKEGEEIPNKGFSILTEHGMDNLTETLIKEGFGDTLELKSLLEERKDFDDEEDTMYDPNDFIAS